MLGIARAGGLVFGIIGILLNIRYFCHNFTQKYCKILTILFCMVNKLNMFYKKSVFWKSSSP
jgi:uncharacterized membrane protein YsdA (DUF1294 family)